jgi:hypothetical protein
MKGACRAKYRSDNVIGGGGGECGTVRLEQVIVSLHLDSTMLPTSTGTVCLTSILCPEYDNDGLP